MKHIKMRKRDKDKWLLALRSGIYVQGKGTLHNAKGNTYCCLGVLCHVLDGNVDLDHTLPTYEWLDEHGIQFFGFGNIRKMRDPAVELSKTMTLSAMNDSGISFQDIAEYLENEIETYA